mmetsp:Transcript_26033/g.61818  ORF Transcript_26033/g.61818 Transcript_26033/m.61818 type:complete len:117 (-) Transcript_26033:27-377(-)
MTLKEQLRFSRDSYLESDDVISLIPGDALIAIADFLQPPERALLAVALTAPSASWRRLGWKGGTVLSGPSRAIVTTTRLPRFNATWLDPNAAAFIRGMRDCAFCRTPPSDNDAESI